MPFGSALLFMLICGSVNPAFPQNQILIKDLPQKEHIPFFPQQQSSNSPKKHSYEELRPKNENPVRFGYKMGMNLSNMNFNRGYSGVSVPLLQDWKTGYLLGLKMEIPLGGKFSLDQEYLYSRVGGEFQPLASTYVLDYLSLPLLLKYRFYPSFSFMAGPNFDLLIKGREVKSGQNLRITKMTEERNVGLNVGLSYRLAKHIELNVRFIQGINHVGIFQRSGRREFKWEVIQLSTELML